MSPKSNVPLDAILREVNEIFCDVLDLKNLKIGYQTNSGNLEEWDSLAHIQLVVAIEKHFNVRFTAKEMQKFNNVGEMCEKIIEKKKHGKRRDF